MLEDALIDSWKVPQNQFGFRESNPSFYLAFCPQIRRSEDLKMGQELDPSRERNELEELMQI